MLIGDLGHVTWVRQSCHKRSATRPYYLASVTWVRQSGHKRSATRPYYLASVTWVRQSGHKRSATRPYYLASVTWVRQSGHKRSATRPYYLASVTWVRQSGHKRSATRPYYLASVTWVRQSGHKSSATHPYYWASVCAVFACVQIILWLPVFRVFNACTDVDACTFVQGLYGHHTKVHWKFDWEKNPLPHWELKPASVSCFGFSVRHSTNWATLAPVVTNYTEHSSRIDHILLWTEHFEGVDQFCVCNPAFRGWLFAIQIHYTPVTKFGAEGYAGLFLSVLVSGLWPEETFWLLTLS